jgi:TolA-binding protein
VVIVMAGCTPEIPEEAFNKGLRALQERNLMGAVVYFEEFCEKYPDHHKVPEAKIHIATCHMQLNELDIAREELIQIIANYSKNDISLGAYRFLATIYAKQKNPDAAVSTLRQLQKRLKNPAESFRISNEIAGIYVRNASWEEAKTEYSNLLADPNTPGMYIPQMRFYLGKTYGESGDKENAIKIFSSLIESVSKSDIGIDSKVEMALIIEDTSPEDSSRLFNEAVSAYQEVIDATVSEGEKVWARGQQGEVFYLMKDYKNAVASFKSIQNDYPNELVVVNLAQSYLDEIKDISPELFAIDASGIEEEAESGAEESTISTPSIGSVSP